MYLVRLPEGQPVQWLFVHSDPRAEGCTFPVQDHVEFEDEAASKFQLDAEIDAAVIVQATDTPRKYKRFLVNGVPVPHGFEVLNGAGIELSSWRRFAAIESKR